MRFRTERVPSAPSRLSGRLRIVGAAAALAALVAAAFLVGRASIDQVTESTDFSQVANATPLSWTVDDQQVGRSLTFVGRLSSSTVPGPLANVDGVVTAVHLTSDGTLVDVGVPLFDVELDPVIAGEGAIPAFRELKSGTVGPDVVQLRRFLCSLEFLTECDDNARFNWTMVSAVDAWRVALGLPKNNGVVGVGDISWFETLPAHVRIDEKVTVGSRIATADRPALVNAGSPDFSITVSRDQAALVPVGARVTFGEGIAGVVTDVGPVIATDAATEQTDAFQVVVSDVAGNGPVCDGDERCTELLGGRTSASVEVDIEVIEERSGPGVPVAAITTSADGDTFVTSVDLTRVPVTILGSSGGMAIVDGVSIGEEILLNGAPADRAN